MKKKTPIVVYVIGFLAAVLFTAYMLLQYRSDVVAMIGTGIVFLLMGYLLFDKIEKSIIEKSKNDNENKKLELLNKIYENVCADTKDMASKQQIIIDQLKTDLSAQKNGLKAIIKYNKENARQIALKNSDDIERMSKSLITKMEELKGKLTDIEHSIEYSSRKTCDAVSDLGRAGLQASVNYTRIQEDEPRLTEKSIIPEVEKELPTMDEQMIPELDEEPLMVEDFSISEEYEEPVTLEPVSAIEDNSATASPEPEEILVPEPVLEPEEVQVPEPAPIPEAPSTPKMPEIEGDPNKKLSADEIAALFASANGASSAPASPEPEEILVPEPVLEPEEVPAPEPAPVPEALSTPKMPEIEGDPNKKLSADEIAALFASANGASSAPASPEPEEILVPEPVLEPEEVQVPEPAPVPEAPSTPKMPEIVGDPNKNLSADEIAALFASVNG